MRIKPLRNWRPSRSAKTSASDSFSSADTEEHAPVVGKNIIGSKNITEEPTTSEHELPDAEQTPKTSFEIMAVVKSFFRLSEVLKIKKAKKEDQAPPEQAFILIEGSEREDRIVQLEMAFFKAREDFDLMQQQLTSLKLDAIEKAKNAKGLFTAKDSKMAARAAKQKVILLEKKMRPFFHHLIEDKKQLLNAYELEIRLSFEEMLELARQNIQIEDSTEEQRQRKNKLNALSKKRALLQRKLAKLKVCFQLTEN